MARKLKTYVTSAGFFDLAVAAPSMKAALAAWGSKSNLFHHGFAKETEDAKVVAATMAKPGVVLRRPASEFRSISIPIGSSSKPTRLGPHSQASTTMPGPMFPPRIRITTSIPSTIGRFPGIAASKTSGAAGLGTARHSPRRSRGAARR